MNLMSKPSTLTSQVVEAIQSVVGSSAVLHEPRFNGNEWKYLKECLDSTFVSSVGEFVDRFESDRNLKVLDGTTMMISWLPNRIIFLAILLFCIFCHDVRNTITDY